MSNYTSPVSLCRAAKDYTDRVCVPDVKNGYYCQDNNNSGVIYDVTCYLEGISSTQKTYCPNIRYQIVKCPTGYYCPDVLNKVSFLSLSFHSWQNLDSFELKSEGDLPERFQLLARKY